MFEILIVILKIRMILIFLNLMVTVLTVINKGLMAKIHTITTIITANGIRVFNDKTKIVPEKITFLEINDLIQVNTHGRRLIRLAKPEILMQWMLIKSHMKVTQL
ncbi:unnamed protein product [Hermetia illucens]|uniref:Uncharacterized protein n=1 Tax=Hermetia illucens TaxID=343691 RepID=A0A7R8YQH8_HERIL|nr:unnamed protein product [Hermetia illucens]